MLKKLVCGFVALGSLGFPSRAAHNAIDSSAGTWKLNEAKSKFAKGQEEKDYTIVIAVAAGTTTVSVNGIGGFFGPGKPISFKFTTPVGGGPMTYIENPPPPDLEIVDVVKDIDDHTTEIISTMHGKPLSTARIVFNRDHKTMVIKTSGVDAKTGRAFKNVEVYERQ
jgi:hypothetical protein